MSTMLPSNNSSRTCVQIWTPAAAKMKSLGITSVEMQIAEGQTHAFFNKQPWKDITLIDEDDFVTNHSYLQGKPTLSMPKTGEALSVKS